MEGTMHYLVRKPWIFPSRQRRRVKKLVIALSIFTAFNMTWSQLTAHAQQSAFDELTAPSNLVAAPVGKQGRAVYSVTGTAVRFEFSRFDKEGTIRVICTRGVEPCGEAVKLKGEPASGGDMLFKSPDGKPVLRVTSAGGGTLFGGASFIPQGIPKTGAAIVRS
ncbi:hypothetical protein [Parvularcula marina]|uniref:hypothetical protein n=1 Tax=Parvularcula marina TaxID=2292771 RepID=UPI003517169A